MPELNFTNTSSGNPSLYMAPPDIFWSAFLLPEETEIPGSSITFGNTVQYQGYYLFAATQPKDTATFVTNAWKYFNTVAKPYQAGGIVWMQAPDDPFSTDNVRIIYLQGAATGFGLLTDFNFNFGNNFSTLTLSANASPQLYRTPKITALFLRALP
jgi:hypothetical protein